MLEGLEMPVKSEVAYLNVLLNLIFQSTSNWKYFQSASTFLQTNIDRWGSGEDFINIATTD